MCLNAAMCTSWLCSKRQSVVGNMRYAKLKLTFSFEEQKLSSLSVLFCGEGSMLSSKIRELLRWARVVFKVTKSVLSYLNHSIDVMLTQFESKILFKKQILSLFWFWKMWICVSWSKMRLKKSAFMTALIWRVFN